MKFFLASFLLLAQILSAADQPPAFAEPVPGAPASPSISPQPAAAPAAPALSSDGGEATDDRPSAPQILEEQLIENSMDVAMGLYHAEDYEGVVRVARKILQSYPKREKKLYKTTYLLALSLEHSNNFPDALVQYQSVIKNRPNSVWSNAAQFRVGICHKTLGNDLE